MSKLFVDEIVHQSSQGSGTITLGASGEKVDLGTGVSGGSLTNTPAFAATLSAAQFFTANSFQKVNFNTEKWDTHSAYDNATNYRFTVPSGQAGKYHIGVQAYINYGQDGTSGQLSIYKNGSSVSTTIVSDARGYAYGMNTMGEFDLSVGDYLEVYFHHNRSAGNEAISPGGTPDSRSIFYGYRLIGV